MILITLTIVFVGLSGLDTRGAYLPTSSGAIKVFQFKILIKMTLNTDLYVTIKYCK